MFLNPLSIVFVISLNNRTIARGCNCSFTISSRLNSNRYNSLGIMAKYSASIPTVMVKSSMVTPEYRDSYDSVSPVASEVSLPSSISSCFILYPHSQPGDVLACEVSTYKITDGADEKLVLQTISDRNSVGMCKLIPGYLKKLKIFTDSIPDGNDVDLLTTRLYCRNSCIANPELWSPSVEHLGVETNWSGGPCQMVCRKGDYKEIQMIHYDSISEIVEGVYFFRLSDVKAGVDIIWNTLPVQTKIQESWGYLNDLVIPPISFAIVESYSWIDVLPNLKYINDESDHFKLKNNRAMSLPNYYSNDSFLKRWSKANNVSFTML